MWTKKDYENWDKERRHEFPNAKHERWESWNGGLRIAGFTDIQNWVLPGSAENRQTETGDSDLFVSQHFKCSH